MPGKNPAEAVRQYIEPIQQSLSCLTRSVIRPSGYDPDVLHTLTFPDPTAEIITASDEILHLSFIQTFSITKPLLLGRFKIRTRSYAYSVEDDSRAEIIGFHWHPETSEIPYPHLHICDGAGVHIRQEIRDIHFRTDRFAFEEFALMLMHEFRVIPERDDAENVLRTNLEIFKKHRTWASYRADFPEQKIQA